MLVSPCLSETHGHYQDTSPAECVDVSACRPNVGWITLPRNLLETQFDSLGLEHLFENGIKDPDSLNGTEKLSDYWDDKDEYFPATNRRGPRNLPNRVPHARLEKTADRCAGSNSHVNGDLTYGHGTSVVCSVCHLVVPTYMRSAGAYKSAHSPSA
jgi:hypothetical protein